MESTPQSVAHRPKPLKVNNLAKLELKKGYDHTNHRNSKMLFNEVYFWTDTIKDWKNLLKAAKYKQLVIYMMKRLVV